MTSDPDPPLAAADLFLSADLTEARACEYLAMRGFRDAVAADQHLQSIADDLAVREALGTLAEDLLEALGRAPDPDAAVAGLAGYTAARASRLSLLRYLQEDLRAIDVLAQVLGASPILTDILIRNPEYFHWLMQQLDRSAPDSLAYAEELDAALGAADDDDARLDALRRFKRRDLLRIAARDLVGQETMESATLQLSDLADAIVGRALDLAWDQAGSDERDRLGRFAIVAVGKGGGRELSYGGDLELLYVYETDDADDPGAHDRFQQLGNRVTALLSEQTGEGLLYRVEVRAGPIRRATDAAYSLEAWQRYYESRGGPLERFDLLKARPLAGDLDLGERFVSAIQAFVYRTRRGDTSDDAFRHNARFARALSHPTSDHGVTVWRSGAREVELIAQVLQLTHVPQRPELWEPNTLAALTTLAGCGVIPQTLADKLARAYAFLRNVGHRVELMQDALAGEVLDAPRQMARCARMLGFESAAALDAALRVHREEVRVIYSTLLET